MHSDVGTGIIPAAQGNFGGLCTGDVTAPTSEILSSSFRLLPWVRRQDYFVESFGSSELV